MKKNIMPIICVVLCAICISVIVIGSQTNHTNRTHVNTINNLQRDDIQAFLYYIEQIMAGEIVYEWDCDSESDTFLAWLSFNSRSREQHPTMHLIDSGLTVLELIIDGDSGEMLVSYYVNYYDAAGTLLRGLHVDPNAPDKWIIERRGGQWVIIEELWHKEWTTRSG